MNEHTLREQLQNEVRRCAEAVARAQEAEADRDRLADALEAERQQVAVESGESDRLEALLEAESRLRNGLTITADSLAASLEDERESVRQLVLILGEIYAALPPHILEANTTSGEIVGWEELPGLVRALVALRNEPAMGILPDDPTGTFKHDPEMTGRMMVLDELTREGQALDLDSPDGPRQEAEGSRQGADRPPVPGVEVPPESAPDEARSGGAWGDYMRSAHICPDCGGNGCDTCGGAGELPRYTAIIKYDPEDRIWYAHLENEPRAHTFGRTPGQALAFAADLPVLWYEDSDATIVPKFVKTLVAAATELIDARCEGESARESEAWVALQDALVASGLIPTEEPT